jgi:cation transport regulator ChaC
MIAILAYGSLIDDSGPEFVINDRPTVIPVADDIRVSARLLVLAPGTTITQAKDMLWRRETGNTTGTYNPPNPVFRLSRLLHRSIDTHRSQHYAADCGQTG